MIGVAHAQQKECVSLFTLSDIHFDPFSSSQSHHKPCPLIHSLEEHSVSSWPAIFSKMAPNYQVMGKDTNFSLLNTMLKVGKKIAHQENTTFILMLGDILGHQYKKKYFDYADHPSQKKYQLFVRKTFNFINQELQKNFYPLVIYPVVGNNDSYHQDYQLIANGDFYSDFPKFWPSLINFSHQPTLKEAGFYAIDLPKHPALKLISLNSVLFSRNAKGQHLHQTAINQLNWLEKELIKVKSKHQQAIIALHIPPSVNIHLGNRIHLFNLMELWHPEYKTQFEQILNRFPFIIAIFAGHLHIDWSSLWKLKKNHVWILGTPSISPIFGNHPSFKNYSFCSTSTKTIEFTTYYFSTITSILYKSHGSMQRY